MSAALMPVEPPEYAAPEIARRAARPLIANEVAEERTIGSFLRERELKALPRRFTGEPITGFGGLQ